MIDLHHQLVRRPRARRVVAALARLGGSAESVLDVGAGDGAVGAALGAALGATRVEGVDVLVQAGAAIPVTAYDGSRLPQADASFELVVLSDVLHHAAAPGALLREALRVARRAVLVKDHLAFSSWSHKVLLAMDVVGNFAQGVAVRGTYFDGPSLAALVRDAGGRVASAEWPLDVHAAPIRALLPSRLQIALRVEHASGAAS